MNKEGRTQIRKPGFCRIAYGLTEPIVSDLTQDISLKGVFIRTPYFFDLGTEMAMELEYYNAEEKSLTTMRFKGKIVRLQNNIEDPGMGVEFIDLDPEKEEFLTKVIAKIPKVE